MLKPMFTLSHIVLAMLILWYPILWLCFGILAFSLKKDLSMESYEPASRKSILRYLLYIALMPKRLGLATLALWILPSLFILAIGT